MSLKIEFHRGDFYEYYFRIVDEEGNTVRLTGSDKLIFSVKKAYYSPHYIIQKSLDNGITWNSENDCYKLTLEHDDSRFLSYADYVFDITIVYDGNKPETHTGVFILKPDVTENEVN